MFFCEVKATNITLEAYENLCSGKNKTNISMSSAENFTQIAKR